MPQARNGARERYRLRARPGAAGFAAAWDAALGKPHAVVDPAGTKSTGLSAAERLEGGLIAVVMRAGRYAGYRRKADDSALLQHLARLDRSCARLDASE